MEPSVAIGAADVFEDDEGAVKLAVHRHARRRAKYIDVKNHLIRDPCDTGRLELCKLKHKTSTRS